MRNDYFLAIDLKSFYAAVECIDRGLDMFSSPLVVCDETRGEGTIVLAVSPCLRALGVPSRLRKFELPRLPNIIFAKPRMGRYLEVSAMFNSLLLNYVGEDDLHIYSVDECFLNVGPYLKMYNMSADELAEVILQDIKRTLGLVATAGIGPNMFLAKVAMDIDAKHQANNIAHWTYDDVPTKLWPITPLSKLWGIAKGYERKLNNLGLLSIGDIATYPKVRLKELFGVMGEELWEHANGIDDTDIRDKYIPTSTSISQGQTLFRNYNKSEAKLLLREMNDDLARRLRAREQVATGVSVQIVYADRTLKSDTVQVNLTRPSKHNNELYEALVTLYEQKAKNLPIRGVHISYFGLQEDNYYQIDFFNDVDEQIIELNLYATLDHIQAKYGLNAVMRSTALIGHSNSIKRHNEIGGHAR